MKKNNKLSRKQFLQIIAVGGTIGIGSKYLPNALSSGEVVSETRQLMGTIVNLTVAGVDRNEAQKAITACLDKMSALENVFSRFKPESQLSVLNRDGRIENADAALLELLRHSNWMSEQSEGAFDITVKPLLDLYQQEAIQQTLPTDEEILRTRKLVNYKELQIDGNTLYFEQENMAITLDGIAKGYIVDAGIKTLRNLGLGNILVEAGGDLLALGKKDENDPWMVGVQSPREEQSNLLARFEIEDQAVATSGDYMQAFTKDFSQHHIIDPRTGYSAPSLASATVLAGKAYLADALATAAMVMGSVEGIQLIEKLPDCEAYLVDKNLATSSSSGFPLG